jgi:hypothetical protein
MPDTDTQEKILFSDRCVYLGNKIVFLEKETWYKKIVQSEQHSHSGVGNCLGFIKQILFGPKDTTLVYSKKREHGELAIIRECPNLMPYYRYIRIGLRLTTKGDYIVRTVYGLNGYSTSDLEEIK